MKFEKFDSTHLKACCHWHSENTPSLIWNQKDNYWKCFGCGAGYSILDHYMQFYNLSYFESVKRLFKETDIDFEFKINKNSPEYFKDYKYPKETINTQRNKVEEYLKLRSISKETLDFTDVKQDEFGNIVFEHRNVDGILLCSKYRPSRAVKKGELKNWWQKDASVCPVLYGIDKIDITKPLVITEGHIDRLSCIEAGFYNAVSIPHGANDVKWIDFNFDFLENFDEIILWADNDEAGRHFVKETVIRLGEHRCKIIEPSEEIEDMIYDFYRKFGNNFAIRKTDANNVLLACGKQYILDLIQNAKEVPIPDVVKLMECDSFDIRKAEGVSTGFHDIDSHIFGNINGTLNIWTGKTGDGKSTVITQSCLNEPMTNDEPVFVFSGELMKGQLKDWVILQLAGRGHIIEWDNGDVKPKTYTVTKEAEKAIREKYMDLIYLYDSYLVATPEHVISRMEYVRKRHGVKNFVIDNVMCFELDIAKHGTELNAQKNLIIQFLQFAVRYNAIVHIVAHPKKPNGDFAINEYDILGSSNIPNLAHRIFSVSRVSERERNNGVQYDGYITILKDRLLGASKKKVGYYYDNQTRRLYGDKDDVNRKYSWDTGQIEYKTTKFGNKGTLTSSGSSKNILPEFMKGD